MKDPRTPVVLTDGNQTLTVIERMKQHLSDNPADYPTLTAAHLMGGALVEAKDTRVRNEIDTILPRDLRARAVGAFLFKRLRDSNPVLLHEVYLVGETTHGEGFIRLLKETERPDSLMSGLSDKELGRAWEIFKHNVTLLAASGAKFRKRKDWRG